MDDGLADLIACVAAFGRSLQETFAPQRFLTEFSLHAQRLVPHDRMIIVYLEDGGRAFTVFAEDRGQGPALHTGRYTTDFDPGGRYAADEWGLEPVFAGGGLLVDDVRRDPSTAAQLLETAIRARVGVPIYAGGRVIGAMNLACFTPGVYVEHHLVACEQIADLIGPFVETVVLLHRERRRRRRLQAVTALAPILGASFKADHLIEQLGEAVRPVLDFDVMAVRVMHANGRDLELIGRLEPDGESHPPDVAPTENYSIVETIRKGEIVLVRDAERELDTRRTGDRWIIEHGRRSLLAVPLFLGEHVDGYAYFAKARPSWYDEADAEIAKALGAEIAVAIQHQRLADERERLGAVEAKARRLEARVESLRDALADRYDFSRIAGRAPAFLAALEQARKVAPTETTVLLTGESGTGKEVIARAIHHASLRADGPFIAINCAALPDTLIESELFGHERGAFSGADRLKRGRFELAAGGTLFLDEIGDLAPAVQAKLLRVLQERQYERVGGTVTLDADVRLVAATNRDLGRAVAEGRFRDDLYYRLAVFGVHLPTLRERGDDVLLLADHFVRELGAKLGKGDAGLSRAAREVLLRHPWPGNIRELQNAIERALIVSDGGLVAPEQLGIMMQRDHPAEGLPAGVSSGIVPEADARTPPAAEPLAELERRSIAAALARAKGNKSRTAAALGLSRRQLYTRLKRFGLDI